MLRWLRGSRGSPGSKRSMSWIADPRTRLRTRQNTHLPLPQPSRVNLRPAVSALDRCGRGREHPVTVGRLSIPGRRAFHERLCAAISRVGLPGMVRTTAVTLLQLEAAGTLNISQILGRWLPEYPSWKQVTIRRLLNMTSGIPDYDDVPFFLKAIASRTDRFWTPAQLI